MNKISDHDIEQELIAITAQLLNQSGEVHRKHIRLDASLQRHLNIDSLARAELFQRIEKNFNVAIPDRLLAEADTLNDIAKFLYQAKPKTKETVAQQIINVHGERTIVDPTAAQTLIDVLLLYANEAPNKEHIYFQNEDGHEEIITYGQLLESSLSVARGLHELGLKEGETVAIMQPTHPSFFYTFFGTLLAGGIPVPIYPPFRKHMLEAYAKTEARILRNAGVRILVTFEQAENLSRLLKAFVPSLRHVTTVDELYRKDIFENPFKAKAENFAFIQYTSGSTNDPKGVLLTHQNLIANIRGYGSTIRVTPDDVAVSWLPLYHDMGLIGMWLGSLYLGVPLILLTPFTFLNRPERWLWAIHYHRGTLSGAPNFGYELCVRKIDPNLLEGLDLSCWRMAANGAEKVYPRTLEQFAKKFEPFGFNKRALLPVYGLAESTVGLAIPPLDRDFLVDHVDRKKFEEDRIAEPTSSNQALQFVSCGLPIAGHEIRIVDKDNHPLPERHVGSLQFRGPSSMQGYYNNPVATQAIYHDGWYDSGDLAYMANHEVYITGRYKDLIIKAGRNLYPAEIEELVGVIPGVRQGCVAAFGTTDTERGTEQLIVVAETREKKKSARATIISNIKEAIATVLDIVPDYVILVTPHTVPKTSSGKLQRAACKKMYLEGKLGRIHSPPWWQITKLAVQGLARRIVTSISTMAKFIYTIYFTSIFFLSIIPVYLIMSTTSREFSAKTARIWCKFLLAAGFCPLKINGLDKINKVSPAIYAANHASYLDTIVAVALVPPNTRFVGKKELQQVPIVGKFMRKLEYVAIDRMDMPKGIEDTKLIQDILKAGNSIFIFPEGTFGYAAGLRPFRLGAFKIATETNVPIIPIALHGTRGILRDDEKLMRPGLIKITVCDPVAPSGKEWEDVTQLRNTIRTEIAKYCGEPSLDFIAAQTVAPSRR